MNAPVRELQIAGDLDDFRECLGHHRWFVDYGILAMPVAVDNLQWLAERWGLVAEYGQDSIQLEIARTFTTTEQAAPPIVPEPEPPRRTYRTPQATIDAFWYVVQNEAPEYLTRWLAEHPRDRSHLRSILERKCAVT